VRAAKHEMEKAVEARSQLEAKSQDQHESGTILAKMIELKESELAHIRNTNVERDNLLMEREGLFEKMKGLQADASRLSSERDEAVSNLKVANKRNEEILLQLKNVNAQYAEATTKLQEQAENWQSRTQGSRNSSDHTPRPNMGHLTKSLMAKEYATPIIQLESRSTADVVAQLYWEIDNLCGEAHKFSHPDFQSKVTNSKQGKVPRYLLSIGPSPPAEISHKELLELAKSFWMQHGMSCFEMKIPIASDAFAAFMAELYHDKAAQVSASVCSALLSSPETLPKPCALLLKLLQNDPDAPLSAEVLRTSLTSSIQVTESRIGSP